MPGLAAMDRHTDFGIVSPRSYSIPAAHLPRLAPETPAFFRRPRRVHPAGAQMQRNQTRHKQTAAVRGEARRHTPRADLCLETMAATPPRNLIGAARCVAMAVDNTRKKTLAREWEAWHARRQSIAWPCHSFRKAARAAVRYRADSGAKLGIRFHSPRSTDSSRFSLPG